MLRREHRTRRHGLRSVGGWLPACAGWLAALSFLTVSCINEYPGEEPSEVSVGSGLALRVSLLDAEGYGDGEGDDLLPPVECMHDLRVIITHKEEIEGVEYEVIEYNRHIDFDDPDYAGKYRYGYLDNANLLFKVREGTPMKKHLYLFSNSEPVLEKMLREDAKLSKHPDPEEGVYGGNHYVDVNQDDVNRYLAALRDATFTQEELDGFVGDDGKVNGIPMSAEYDVEVEPGNTGVSGLCVIGDLHLVRACNKITFEYENYRPQYPIFVQNWVLNLVAKDAYLLPRVKGGGPLSGTGGEDIRDGSWIKWYADHIGTDGHADELNFEVPLTTNYNSYNGRSDGEETYADLSVTEVKPDGSETVFKEHVTGLKVGNLYWNKTDIAIPGKKTDGKVYYFPETRYIPTNSDTQKYTMSFKTMEYNASASGSEVQHWVDSHSYESGPMENVSTLFRNTHVQIRATFMEGKQVDLNVSIINWGENNPVHGTLTPEN